MKFVCVTKCFYRGTLWRPGETLDADLKDAPTHFIFAKDYKPTKVKSEDPKTFEELQRMEAMQALKSVGHKSPNANHTSEKEVDALLK